MNDKELRKYKQDTEWYMRMYMKGNPIVGFKTIRKRLKTLQEQRVKINIHGVA